MAAQEPLLTLDESALRCGDRAHELYEAALRPRPRWRRAALAAWTAFALPALCWLAWAEPWSGPWLGSLRDAGRPGWLVETMRALIMAARGVLLVESAGYAFHRFFQHPGWLTRRALLIRKSQRFHWIHHMILYPIGRFYKRPVPYVSSEGEGVGLSWTIPSLVLIAAFFATMGLSAATATLVFAAAAYAYFLVDGTHARFHMERHAWAGRRYFRWLEEIHLLHHWDQRTNFTIVHPFMDALFGTYLSPRRHRRELDAMLRDTEITVSDLINWRYLLFEATPAEYAAFISEARRHPRSLRKIGHMLEVLRIRLERRPVDAEAALLRRRTLELLEQVRGSPPTPPTARR